MGKSQPEKTQLAELTLRDIANAGADLHEFAAVVPFTLEGNGQRAYIPTSVLRYYNPKVKLEPKDIRYLDPDFFEARIRDIGANPAAKPYQRDVSTATPAYGSFVWLRVPLEGGSYYDVTPTEAQKLMMLLTTTDKHLMIAADVYPPDIVNYLSKVFQLTAPVVQGMLRTFREKDFIWQNDRGEWLFNQDLFRRGEITRRESTKAEQSGFRYVRMYFSSIAQMYRTESMSLGLKYLLPMLPYLHKDFNVFCLNPFQDDPFLVAPLTAARLCAAGGYERSGYGELTSLYYNQVIRTSKGTETIMTRLKEPFHGLPVGSIMLNPRVFYTGSKVIAAELEPLFLVRKRGKYKKRRKKTEN